MLKLQKIARVLIPIFVLSASPNAGFGPLKVNIRVRHTPSINDRSIKLGIYCGDFEEYSSEHSLDGDKELPFFNYPVKLSGCPSAYGVGVWIKHSDGSVESRTLLLKVFPPD